MSSAASWSYTADITIWKRTGIDDWTGQVTFSPPIVFKGDYSAQSERMVSSSGNDFVSKQIIYTEFDIAEEGDYLKIGNHFVPDPFSVGAQEILLVLDYGDTLERKAPDYKLVT